MAPADRAALLALYRSANGTGWSNNRNWDTEAELSQWHGVKVNEEGRVVKLRLGGNSLRGIELLDYVHYFDTNARPSISRPPTLVLFQRAFLPSRFPHSL